MSTNLALVSDHPVQVLLRTPNSPVGTFTSAAQRLSTYEQEKGVTFAALDNDTLAEVRESYERLVSEDDYDKRVMAANALACGIRDLLGLED